MSDDNWWADSPFATAGDARKARPMQVRAEPTPQDLMLLKESTDKAEGERRARRGYSATRRAVRDFGTGPNRAWYFDAITPGDGEGILGTTADAIGGVLGWLPRQVHYQRTLDARDHLKTVSAQGALAGSQMMKGSSSDKDTALMREAAVSPYKTERENYRILDEAERESGLAQARALHASKWIAKYGSIAQPAPGGKTYEQGLAQAERGFLERIGAVPRRAPPSTRRRPAAPASGARQVYDINGNPL